ncbi:unnamed protein product [Psylliodes chrysocephalus]|uniref:Kinesin-like protein n=1 Tax=Psylliodes chrysocephalus TaxID=3402493 RepID=A0A9P0GET3_9CUCU|nr:unnamed protein product [Psylliodes chrysocephala]
MFSATKFTPTPRKIRREKTVVSSSSSDIDKDPVHVFCRLRPLQENVDSNSCMTLLSPQEICIANESKGIRRDVFYKFKHIFTAYASQTEIFDHIGYPLLTDLLKGKNGLLFAYGVTGSGKTYTLTGDHNNPGLMPMCIDTLFNSIGDLQTPKFIIKSDRMNGFEIQTEEDASMDRLAENRSKNMRNVKKLNGEKFFINNGKMIPVFNENNAFAVFISYIEIYNNNVYDLLDKSNNEKFLQNKILREDPNRNMYVNGVLEVEVKSAQEAFELFIIGQKRKKMGYTNLNSESSRSHSVFNIRIAQLEKLPVNADGKPIIPEKNLLTVSQLSLVDLAGSERSSRTQNTGARLREASAINNSLMNLRTCLEVLRENQRTKTNKVVPYRDSRLTYLFKNYFEGDGSVQMMVCVNPSVNDLEENLHVMKFAEMTQGVKVMKSEPRCIPISTSKKVISKKNGKPAKINKKTLFSLTPEIPVFKFDFNQRDECRASIDNVLGVLKHLKSKSSTSELDNINTELRKRLVDVDNHRVLDKAERHNLKQLLQREQTKSTNFDTKTNLLETKYGDLSEKYKETQEIIRSLHNAVNEKDLKLNQQLLEMEHIEQKLALANENKDQELQEKLKKQRGHFTAEIFAKEIQLKKAREALNSEVSVNPENIREIGNIPLLTLTRPSLSDCSKRNGGYTSRRRSKSCDKVWL